MSQTIFAHIPDSHIIHIQAFVGGYYDVAGYFLLHGVFTTSITGNLVVACASVSDLKGVLCRALVCIAFIVSGFLCAMMGLNLRNKFKLNGRLVCLCMFGLELLAMIASWILGLQFEQQIKDAETIDQWQVILVACVMGASMGFHNVAMRESIANCPPTTVMTNTMINVASTFASAMYFKLEIASSKKTDENATHLTTMTVKYDEWYTKFSAAVKPLLFFIIGAIIGAVITDNASFWMNAVPVFIVATIMCLIVSKEMTVRKEEAAKAEAAAVAAAEKKVESVSSGNYTELTQVESKV